MEQPLSKYDCDAWRTRLDTLMHDATLATALRWEQEVRALATIDRLRAVNAKLLGALEAVLHDRQTQDYGHPTDATLELARAAIEEARK